MDVVLDQISPEFGIVRLEPMAAAATSEGFHHVERTVQEWASGTNRFDLLGEGFFTATVDKEIVGVCGLNIDPYLGDSRCGRLRHLYVAADVRRHGVGRLLVDACLGLAVSRFDRVRLRTTNPDAAMFYERLGWERIVDDSATHVISTAARRK